MQRDPQQAATYRQDIAVPRYLASAPNLLGPAPAYDIAPIIPPGDEPVLRENPTVQKTVTVDPKPVAPPLVVPPLRRSLAERVKIQAVPLQR